MSVVVHEVSHGWMAYILGDPTAKMAGRLTLNPIPHIDPVGSIIVPLVLSLLPGGIVFGWAKPVPYNPNNLSNRKWGTIAVAAAGVLANFLIAIIFGIIIRLVSGTALPPGFYFITSAIVVVNLALAIFNLVPIPPLDGSRVLFAALPQTRTTFRVMYFLERWGLVVVLLFVFFGFQFIVPIVSAIFTFLTGQSFGM